MARAKRTDRAEARRRHRAEIAAAAVEPVDEEEEGPEPSPAPGRRNLGQRPAGPPPRRPSTLRAFRDAYQPADVRGDLQALPELIRSRAVWLPALLVLVSTMFVILTFSSTSGALAAPGSSASPSAQATQAVSPSPVASASPGPSDSAAASASPAASGGTGDTTGGASGSLLEALATIMALLFLEIPPIGGIYLAAILAKRSSYLAGAIAGFLGPVGLIVASIVGSHANGALPVGAILAALVQSTVFGLLIGAGLGYYRRLLRLMNPTPNRPASRSKPAARRR